MTLPDIRLIATDMDGTLLNNQGEVSEAFFPIFKKLRQHNILFAAASGRQYFNLTRTLRNIQHEIIFVAENGSYVIDQDKELLVQALDHDTAMDLVALARTVPDAYTIVCGKKSAYIENDDPKFTAHLCQYFEKYQVVNDLTKVQDEEFLKITVCDFAGTEEHAYPYFQHLEGKLKVKVSGHTWLDISHLLADKGRAIKTLQETYDISPEQTMVFGDYLNDVEMMQSAYFSYAMANAHADVKEAARFTAKSNDENGVVEILQELIAALERC